ncbi:MAG: S9 family peptidase [Deltaproteobacteria bacterium]|nr:S9 family peptidase [Deltaproteobacteria bacterium]
MTRRAATALVGIILLSASIARADGYPIEQYLNIRSAVGGSWSPDGATIAYLYNESGTHQVWTIPAAGGDPKQVTKYNERVAFVDYSPTEPVAIFGMDEGGNERTQLYLLDPAGGEATRLTKDDDAIHEFGGWSHDGRFIAYAKNTRDARFFDIYVMDMKTRDERLVLQHDAYNEVAAWSWDDKYLVVSTWESSFNNDLTVIELSSLKDQHLTPHTGWATYTDVAWPPHEDFFYLVTNLRMQWAKLGQYKLKDQAVDIQDTAPWDTEGVALSRDGNFLAYALNVHGYARPVVIDVKERKAAGYLQQTDGRLGNFRWSPDGTKLLYNYSSPTRPWDVWIYDRTSERAQQLTHSDLAGIPAESFIGPEFVQYRGHGGLKIPGYLYLPPGMKKDRSNAVMIYAHGGPEAQERPDFAQTFQYLLGQGVAIFAPNVRGSAGYGKSYIHLDDKRNRLDNLRDYAAAVLYLRELDYFDEKKIGIYGGSYGGYVVLGSLTEYPDLYACGVSVVGISNFVTFLEKTGPWRRAIREAEYGTLADDRAFLETISPVHKADRIRSPLMIIQGANDPRVPQNEAEQMVDAMKKNNLPVEYLLYVDEGHGLTKLKNRLDAYPKMVDFLSKYLIKKAPAPNGAPAPGSAEGHEIPVDLPASDL